MNEMVRLQGSHYDIGFEHGQKLRRTITDTVIPFVKQDMATLGISEAAADKIAAQYQQLIAETYPELLDETRGISEGAEISYASALIVLFFWEIRDTVSHSLPQCSSFVATGAATRDGAQIASQNSDWSPDMMKKQIGFTFRINPRSRYGFIGRGLAGNLGRPSVIGFNEKGLTFVGSGIRQLRGGGFGLPPLIATRIGLESCSTVDEFIDYVKQVPKWSHAGENVDIADAGGNIARISFSTNNLFIVQSKDHFIVSTNHYHNKEMRYLGPASRDEYPSSYSRYDRLVELLTDNYGQLDLERTRQIMSDHKYGNTAPDGANSICRHGEGIQTRSNVILQPKEKMCWVANSSPCSGEYVEYRL